MLPEPTDRRSTRWPAECFAVPPLLKADIIAINICEDTTGSALEFEATDADAVTAAARELSLSPTSRLTRAPRDRAPIQEQEGLKKAEQGIGETTEMHAKERAASHSPQIWYL